MTPYRSCPPRPRPCEVCQSWKNYKRILKNREFPQAIVDKAFMELQKKCEPCRFPDLHHNEPDYVDECRRAINARRKLERIEKGEIQVKQAVGPIFD